MSVTINGSGTITGISAGGLPDDCIVTDDIAAAAVTPAKLSQPFTAGTSVASTSGTSIDFTGIPSWVKRITVMLSGVSTNGTSAPLIQIGDAGGIETSGYTSTAFYSSGDGQSTVGFEIPSGNASNTVSGLLILALVDSSVATWSASGSFAFSTIAAGICGTKALSQVPLDRVRITTVNGTDTFDGGIINILYE
jgi:hypothetical protein